jgi:hypothetical protein
MKNKIINLFFKKKEKMYEFGTEIQKSYRFFHCIFHEFIEFLLYFTGKNALYGYLFSKTYKFLQNPLHKMCRGVYSPFLCGERNG